MLEDSFSSDEPAKKQEVNMLNIDNMITGFGIEDEIEEYKRDRKDDVV
jgi:hypothetical protein